MRRGGVPITVAIVLLGLSLAPAAYSQQAEAPPAQGDQSAPAPTTKSNEAPPPKPAETGYVISPGDVVAVQVWKEPEVSTTVPVRPDGKISLPLLNDVQAAGLTASALAADLTDRLKKYISDPQVTVILTQVNSQRFYITGEVNRGGTYPLEPGMTVLQGLSSAGGFTPFANLKKIYVLRKVNGTQTKYPFNYKNVVKGKDTDENIVLQPGDTIVVP
jgi:polysaccharide export outer membrane protein